MTLLNGLRKDLRSCLDLLLPAACAWCGSLLPPGSGPADICPSCFDGIEPLPASRCPRCALPHRTRSSQQHHCEQCLRCPPSFQKTHALGRYSGSLRHAIHRFKYRDNPGLSASLGQLLIDYLSHQLGDFHPDLIAPVPLHPQRLKRRGYHQGLELARPLSRDLSIPLEWNLLKRIQATRPQQGQNAIDRQTNLQGAFAATHALHGERVLLVDDVMTTTATTRQCAEVLEKNGAGEIQVAVLGRA